MLYRIRQELLTESEIVIGQNLDGQLETVVAERMKPIASYIA